MSRARLRASIACLMRICGPSNMAERPGWERARGARAARKHCCSGAEEGKAAAAFDRAAGKREIDASLGQATEERARMAPQPAIWTGREAVFLDIISGTEEKAEGGTERANATASSTKD